MKKKRMIILLVLLLTIGFASVSTTLVMNGVIGIANKKSDFNVIFTSATINGNNEAKATISENKKTITFETDKLSVVGDSAELIYKVKNNSTQYDANVTISCTGGNEEYLNIESEFAGKTLPLATPEFMEAQEVRMGRIRAELIKSYVGEDKSISITCKIEVEGEERDSIVEETICEYPNGTEWTFDYTGSEQEFVIPCSGEYKLETWGAQGGNAGEYTGGYGGFSNGNIDLNENEVLYINVGGAGEAGAALSYRAGGYNGGGSTEASLHGNVMNSGGGGATHIALISGLLSTLKNNTNQILIVAGGGGGAHYHPEGISHGGVGGGYVGGSARNVSQATNKCSVPTGGTQASGGTVGVNYTSNPGTFGKGGDHGSSGFGAGGGGGWYGGGSGGCVSSCGYSGGGGSGYIGNSLLKNKTMYCYNCAESSERSTKTISTTSVSSSPISNYAKQGNGYAKITLLSAKQPKEEYKEAILNGTDPVIKEELIPVTIENDGTVKKADTTSEWYSYENKRWANAVILSDETINYNANEVIPEENIESYFVWIPKYKYQLWNVASTTSASNKGKHSIEIVFGTENTDNVEGVSCVTPMESGTSGECNVGEYMTHPAFISMGTTGIWVGKFETTGSVSSITIKPNTTSLQNLTVKNMFDVSYNYQRTLDSHMMKNTEWGAVAYLSHSKYGIDSEVNINNNSNNLTGYSSATGVDQSSHPGTAGTDASVTLPYNTETGYKASTTGNITGIYDMSGGAHEYTASYISGQTGASEFSDVTNPSYTKYLDVYSTSSAIQAYQYRILGDATGEMGPFSTYKDRDGNSRHHNGWYADTSHFVDSTYPWFSRGGYYDYGVLASQFLFGRGKGSSATNAGFRLVLT